MKRFLLIIAMLAACCLVFTACDTGLTSINVEETDIKRERYEYSLFPLSARGKNAAGFIIKSAVDKEVFIEHVKEGYFDYFRVNDFTEVQKDWETSVKPSLTSFFGKFDNDFFTDSNLVMILINNDKRHQIRKISEKNKELYIIINRIQPGIGYVGVDDIFSWSLLIPLKKKDFNANKINIEVRNTRLW